MQERHPANKALDFFMGCLGLMGLIIQIVRQSDNRINWKYFADGFVAATFALLVLI